MAHSLHLRPLHQHRPSELRTGGRTGPARGRTAVVVAIVLAALVIPLATACGDDDDGGGDPTQPSGGAAAKTAAELTPDVSDLGFKAAVAAPGFAETATTKVSFFENPTGKVSSLRLEVSIAPTLDAATTTFNAFATALKNPPPDLFGADAKQLDGSPVFQADQSRSYRTDKPDGQGKIAFSDVHRFGRAVVVMYSIGPPGADTDAIRKQVAERINAKAPR